MFGKRDQALRSITKKKNSNTISQKAIHFCQLHSLKHVFQQILKYPIY